MPTEQGSANYRDYNEEPPEVKILHLVNGSDSAIFILRDLHSNNPEHNWNFTEEDLFNTLREKVDRLRQITDIPTPELQQKVDEFCELVEKSIAEPNQKNFDAVRKTMKEINELIPFTKE